ncbi:MULTISPECIES: trimeric intracellular cation channel family protein [Actinoalloteichus]|uniref:Membrane protein YeiH n=1 Tax=Actinoalloteichus caeruleus DSM 43889 TaxID=1120930 RepID=A0ABT1JBB2_ACTCY|nr:TRIC cation channel family protein [Actinoalloteichus caeruleus]MCP2329784.1 putative membrane protein YeiH [Actinoalloteichus caeruleus DSM 43889]
MSGTTSIVALEGLTRTVDLIGVGANAVLGGMLARSRNFDAVGFLVLAIVSGLGGGLIRDTLLQQGTPVALTDYAYLLTALGGALVAFLLQFEHRVLWRRGFPVVDAAAVGCWAAAGAGKTLDAGLGWLPAVLLGTITAVGGGMTRDIMLGQIPRIFGGGPLYATCAAIASGALVVLAGLGLREIGVLAALLLGTGLCLVSQWRGWTAPRGRTWGGGRAGPPEGSGPPEGPPPAPGS